MILCIIFLLWVSPTLSSIAPEGSVPMKIVNRAHQPIDLFWINVFEVGEPLVPQLSKPIRNNSDTVINSYDTHEFILRYHNSEHGLSETRFVKGPEEETILVYSQDETNELYVIHTTKIDDVRDAVHRTTEMCDNISKDGNEFDGCVADGLVNYITDISKSMSEVKKYRDRMAEKLRNYTCADENSIQTTPLKIDNIKIRSRPIEVETLLDLKASKIWVAHNFVSDEECDVLMNHGRPLLKRATIAAEDGTSIVSPTRKAQQASYNFPSNKPENDPLWDLYSRILSFVNLKTNYELKFEGQEEFAIIQYDPTDEYGSHCDADCNGETYTPRGRVATAVLYCKVPEIGGGTTFSKSDIFVKPRKGDVTFFAYKGEDNKMDTGFTEHSGCPVVEGEKWIATAWLRQGVTKQDPWNDYDPSGIPIYYGNAMKEAEVTAV